MMLNSLGLLLGAGVIRHRLDPFRTVHKIVSGECNMPGLPRRPAQRRGHNARLTDEQVVEIASRTDLTQVELAKMYGVTQCQISRIRAGQSWGWLTASVKREDNPLAAGQT